MVILLYKIQQFLVGEFDMTNGWLTCKVKNGMFSNEHVVTVTTSSGQEVSYFVPSSVVRDDKQVQVKVIEQQPGSSYLVVLPNEEQSIVPVDAKFVAA
jgi:hypothetical protein